MNKLGLIGYPLSHSFSPIYFKSIFEKEKLTDWTYELYPIEHINEIIQLIETEQLKGFNVTIPHKQSVMNLCDELTENALNIGAVNCVKVEFKNNKPYLIGENTDYIGFEKSLMNWYQGHFKKALVLGNGGSSKAIKLALENNHFEYINISRNNTALNYSDLNRIHFSEFDLIINCTPVGMYPKINDFLTLPYNEINSHQYFYDLVYNPIETKMMSLFRQKGATVKNGQEMLEIQAEAAWEFFKK